MRVTGDNIDYRTQQARSRRRIALILFGIFVSVCLFALLYVLQRMSIRYPPDVPHLMAELAEADAFWILPAEDLPILAGRFLDDEQTADAVEQFARIRQLLHPETVLFFYESDTNTGATWVFTARIQRPQQAVHKRMEDLLREGGSTFDPADGEIESVFQNGRIFVTNNSGSLTGLLQSLSREPDYTTSEPRPVAAAPVAEIDYEGPWSLLDSRLQAAIQDALPQAKAWDISNPRIQLSWPKDDGSPYSILHWNTDGDGVNPEYARLKGLELLKDHQPGEVTRLE